MLDIERLELKNAFERVGDFAPLDIKFEFQNLESQLTDLYDAWRTYNPRRPECRRAAVSLTSLDGSSDEAFDVESLQDHNRDYGTDYNLMSFRQPTFYWKQLHEITKHLEPIQSSLGLSHVVQLGVGGHFPPQRKFDDSFELIAFLNCDSHNVYLTIEEERKIFVPNTLYYINQAKLHSIYSFIDGAIMLKVNGERNAQTFEFLTRHIFSY